MEEKKIIAYKGFDKNLKCREFQYEVGKEYEMDGDDMCNTSLICKHFHCLLHGYEGELGVFKELKEEK